MAHYIDLAGEARPNPSYTEVPPLQKFTVSEWSGPSPERPLYRDYVEDPGQFDWIIDPELVTERFPALWARVADVASRQGGS